VAQKGSENLFRRSGLLTPVFVFSVFVNLLMLTGPLFMLQVYDRVLGSRSEETLMALFALVAALYLLMGVLDYARGRLMARVAARIRARLDGAVFNRQIELAVDPRKRAEAAKGLRNLEAVQSFLTSPVVLALFDIPWTPLFLAAIFIFHPMLGWLAVAGGGFLIIVTLLNNVLTRKKVARAQEVSQWANALSEQARSGSEIVRAQGMNASIASRWRSVQNEALDQSIAASDWTGGFTSLTKSFRLFLQSAMLAVGAYLVLRGELTAGAMIAGSILLGRALAPIEQSIGQWALIQRARTGWADLKQEMSNLPEDTGMVLPVPKASLQFENVSVFAVLRHGVREHRAHVARAG